MYSLHHLEALAERASRGLTKLNTRMLEMLGKRIAQARKSGGFDRLNVLGGADGDIATLTREISTELARAGVAAQQVLTQAGKIVYTSAAVNYAARGLVQAAFENHPNAQAIVQAVGAYTRGLFTSLSNTTVIGLRVKQLDGSITYRPFATEYRRIVDQAIMEVAGGRDYGSAVRNAMRQVADSGLRFVEYQSGYSRRLDSALKQNVLDGVREIARQIQEQTGREFGATGVEIDAHNNCAPDHLPYQGRVFTNAEYAEVQAALDRQFMTLNCRHTLYPVIIGLSEPNYSEAERRAMAEQSTAKREFEGREYTAYEATQLQRRTETAIRRHKDRAVLAKAAEDDLTRRIEQAKINALTAKYAKLSKAFELPYYTERMSVAGFRPVRVKR